MPKQDVNRKLAAILSADVKGYSRLMEDDEEATIHTLTAYREVMTTLIGQHRGRVVDSPGDNVLAEFASVVDAAKGAVEVQKELQIRNAELPPDRKMEFRIGINLGDVLVEGDRLYGDGVNIAARIEGLAEGGGICISGTVYDQIENKLSLGYEYLGEQTVKNITRPIKVYAVRAEPGGSVPLPAQKATELPEKPSIAVLPFANMSGDPEQEYFSDGITEDIITDLSKISGLFVIARNSVFRYKDKTVKPEEISRELGVRYLLEGSVRKAGRRVRITAQLVDAATAGHLWAERYDRDLEDIFAVQDEVTQKIVGALEVQLTQGERERVKRPPTSNLEAYEYFLRGREHHAHRTQEANAQAQAMFQRATELDPEFAAAHAWLGRTHVVEWLFQWNQDADCLEEALANAQRAVALDESLPAAHETLGYVHLAKREFERAVAEGERAVALDPNDADAAMVLAEILNCADVDRAEEAIALVQKAMRLNPHYPASYLFVLGQAYGLAGRGEEAIALLKRVLTRNPDHLAAHLALAWIYKDLGREDEAREDMEALRRLEPKNVSLEEWIQRIPFKDQERLDRLASILGELGLE
jgi:adenylate cyclase